MVGSLPLTSAPVSLSVPGQGLMGNANKENKQEPTGGKDASIERNEAEEQTPEQKAEEQENQEEEEQEGEEEEEKEMKENELESQESKVALEAQSSPLLCLTVLSGTDPKLGAQLCEAAANGENGSPSTMPRIVLPKSRDPTGFLYHTLSSAPVFSLTTYRSLEGALLSAEECHSEPDLCREGHAGPGTIGWSSLFPFTGQPVLLTNVELGLGCQELQWLLHREQLMPPHVQPGFCLYLSTTLPLHALQKGETRGCLACPCFVGTLGPRASFILAQKQAQNCSREPHSLSTLPPGSLPRGRNEVYFL